MRQHENQRKKVHENGVSVKKHMLNIHPHELVALT